MKIPVWLVLVLVVAAPAVRADDTGLQSVALYGGLGVAAGLFDIGATIYDIRTLTPGERPSRAYGVVETALAVPQMAIAAYVFSNPPPADGVRTLSALWFLWASALAAHGIWTWVRPDEPAPRIAIGVRPVEAARMSSAPLLWSVSGCF